MEKRKPAIGYKNTKSINYLNAIKAPKLKKQPLAKGEFSDGWDSGNPFELGLAYLKNKNYPMAISSLQENLELDAECHSTRYGLGVAFMSLEKYHEAIIEFKQLLLKEPSNLEARLNLATAYLKLEKFEQSIREFYTLLKLDKHDENRKRLVNVLYSYANRLYKESLFEKAAENYQQAIELDDDNPAIYHRLGLCYKELENYPAAVSSFENALKHYKEKEKQLVIYNLLIELKIKKGENDEALHLCSDVLDIAPNNAGANYLAGEIYFERKQYDAALRRYTIALGSQPGLIQALLNIGQIYVFKEQFPKALAMYNKVLKIENNNPVALCNISIIKYKQGDKNTAFEQLSKLSGKEGENIYLVHKYLGLILLERGLTDGAIVRFTRAIVLHPDDPDNYINLGVCFHKKRDLERAVAEYLKAVEIDPENLVALKNLALLYSDAHLKTEALELYEKILVIDPGYKLAHKNMANLNRRAGDIDKAVEQYQAYLEKDGRNGEVLFTLGTTFFEAGQLNRAAETFKRLIKIDKSYSAPSYCYLSKIYEKSKQYKIALEYARNSIYMNINYVDGLIQYAVVAILTGNMEKALSCIDRVLAIEPENKDAEALIEVIYPDEEEN